VIALTVVVALAFAFVLGVSDAPNATAALVGTHAARYRPAAAFSFVFHVAGGVLGGSAVAVTIGTLLDLTGNDLVVAYAAGCLAAVVFTLLAARVGLPTSASFGLVGGLVGAGLVSGGLGAVAWGGVEGLRPTGVGGILAWMVVSPLIGVVLAAALRAAMSRALRRVTRRALGPIRAGIWISAAAVAFSDGTNDGQKAMGVITGALVAGGAQARFSIPTWARLTVAVVLATGTAVGGRRLIRTVGRRLYRQRSPDGLAAQCASAISVLTAAALGAPVSTASVVAGSVVGVGLAQRRRHVHWPVVRSTLSAWCLTLPVCAALGAAAVPLLRVVA